MTVPIVYSDVTNWWYHFYSRGENAKFRKLSPIHFILAEHKVTPDFENYLYNYAICHPQIGKNITPSKSIVILKTTVGMQAPPKGYFEKATFIVGYYRVSKLSDECIIMDRDHSLLLLDDPIKIDLIWAKKLFPRKPNNYWSSERDLVRKIGTTTRNCHIEEEALRLVLQELVKRRKGGTKNYMGEGYRELLSRLPRQELLTKYINWGKS